MQQNVPVEKREKHKKFRLIEKEYAKRKNKYEEARVKATRARNEYLLCMDAANSSIQKYFVDDLSDLIDVRKKKMHTNRFNYFGDLLTVTNLNYLPRGEIAVLVY